MPRTPFDDMFDAFNPPAAATVETDGDGGFLVLPRDVIDAGRLTGLRLRGVRRYMTLNRPQSHPYWTRPATGAGADLSVIQQSQCLLVERDDGRVGVLLPLVDEQTRATLFAEGATLTLRIEGPAPDPSPAAAVALYVAVGDDPIALMQQAMAAVARRTKTFAPRDDKRQPTFVDQLGWCTWDAFYQDVTEEKVLAGLRSFADGGVRPGLLILDDGWQDTTGDFLNGFGAHPTKFPSGLSPLIDRAKREFGVRLFGVWHAFHGYWAGVNPDGPLAERYGLVANRGCIRPWKEDKPLSDTSMVAPQDVQRFYDDYHDALRRAGVDMVKIDNQSATEIMTGGKLPRVPTMRRWQRAMQAAAAVHFGNEVLHCMCHASDVGYNMLSSVAFRNSDDFFPNRPESHQRHLHENAMTALWSAHFGLPDWDMFWSSHPQAAFHAAARAVSGGPVYVSDKPGQHDFALLKKLITSDGRVLRSDRPALPARDCVFVDQRKEQRLLKLTNLNGGTRGVIGLFHCAENAGPITDAFRPADVHDLPAGDRFAVYLHRQRKLIVVGRDGPVDVTLDPIEWEIATIAPITADAPVPVGLLDKLNGSAAVEASTGSNCTLRDGGRIGFYAKARPKAVRVNGTRVDDVEHDPATGLLVVPAREGGPVTVELTI